MNLETLDWDEELIKIFITVKRKYTSAHPSYRVSTNAPIREKVLSFVKESGTVTHKELMEFISGMNEETGGSTNRKWVSKNNHYFVVREKDGVKTYRLSSLGEHVHAAILKQVS